MAFLNNIDGPDLIIMGLIIAVLSAPGVIAIAIVLILPRRKNRPPPLPTSQPRR